MTGRAFLADRLIDGSGREPFEQAVIVWDGERITGVGPRSAVSMPRGVDTTDLGDLTLLPGLMDMHVHLGARAGNAGTPDSSTPARARARGHI